MSSNFDNAVVDIASGLYRLWVKGSISQAQVDSMLATLGVDTDWQQLTKTSLRFWIVDPSTKDRIFIQL